ncbi:apolipoprotein N-acyltransferase [Methylibium sp.]|uniref:apolipoprotein N-acyltransferase n=1 Tax=Methylibium sp. TaxID=2067992 RepID=UPI0025DAA6FC|nr:apolipoprotein N-acyltransferase [Methylibium sp.]
MSGRSAGSRGAHVASRRWPLAAELLVATAAGALHALSFSRLDLGWLQLACVALLAWRVGAGAAPGRAALIGGMFSTAWLIGGTWWLFISLHRYGGMPAWLAGLAVGLLCALLSLYLAAAMAAWARWRSGRPAADALLFAAVWLLAELARGVIFTGFPWVAAGYAHTDGTLGALAPWIGVYGIGAVAAGIATLLAAAMRASGSGRWLTVAGGAALWWAPLVLPQDFTEATGRLEVALLQGNVPQEEKFEPAHQPEALAWTLRTLAQTQADLVVAPETAVPLLPAQMPEGLWENLRGAFAGGDRAALVGMPLGSFEAGYTNSAVGFSAAAATRPGGFYRYDKHHLVPFGEFIPPGFRWFVDLMKMPLGDFARGPLDAPSFAVQGERVAPNICYEDLFGEELAARFRDPATAPTIFANVSNIAWFGESIAVFQHLQISRMRTLELQRPMIRATNTGATAIVDHRGVVTHRLAPHTRGMLHGTVEGRSGLTPFAEWAARMGLAPLALLAAAVLAAAAWRVARDSRTTPRRATVPL